LIVITASKAPTYDWNESIENHFALHFISFLLLLLLMKRLVIRYKLISVDLIFERRLQDPYMQRLLGLWIRRDASHPIHEIHAPDRPPRTCLVVPNGALDAHLCFLAVVVSAS